VLHLLVPVTVARLNGHGRRRRAVRLSAIGSHTTSTWCFAFSLVDNLFLFFSSIESDNTELCRHFSKRRNVRRQPEAKSIEGSKDCLGFLFLIGRQHVPPDGPVDLCEQMRYHRSYTPVQATLAGTISLNHLPGRSFFLRDSLPQCPTGCKSEPPSNLPGQPIPTWSPFHSVSPNLLLEILQKLLEPLSLRQPRPSYSRLAPLWANRLQNRRKGTAPRPPRRLVSSAHPQILHTIYLGRRRRIPTAPISMNRLEEIIVCTESPRHFPRTVVISRHGRSLCSACALPTAAERILQLPMRVYITKERPVSLLVRGGA